MRLRTGAGAAPEITCASFEQFKRELVEPRLSRNNGRLIKTTGDGALDEFASPLAVVTSAWRFGRHRHATLRRSSYVRI